MSFKITTPTGKYKIGMRAGLAGITSEKKLRASIQKGIDRYAEMPGWERYAERTQQLLDANEFHRISEAWGLFSTSIRIEKS